MQSKEELEKHYVNPDPWGYKTNPEDQRRKRHLIDIARMFGHEYSDPRFLFKRALDIACGEGWITGNIPAFDVEGYEISDLAASRFPKWVKRASPPEGKYDFVMATGCLYGHYDWKSIVGLINAHAEGIVMVSNIESWEHKPAISSIEGKEIFTATFPYNEHNQKVRVFRR